MSAELDHLVVTGATLDAAVAHVEAALGCALDPGGAHAAFSTHNRLLSLGPGLYLEAIAPDPAAPPPGRARWFGLDTVAGPPSLSHWAVRVPDLSAAQAAGAAPGDLLDLARGGYRWRMAVPQDGRAPIDGLFPAVLEWQGPHPAAALPDRGCRLQRLVLRHPAPAALAALPAMHDPRISVEPGPPGVSARIETPSGDRWL